MKRSRILGLIAVLVVGAVVFAAVPWERYPALDRAVDIIQKSLGRPLLHVGRLPVSPDFLLKAVVFLLLLGFVARRSRRLFRVYLLDRLAMEEGHKYSLETATEYLIVIVGLMVGLQSAGVNLSSLALLGGALGIGVGFGLQSIATNFVSGLVLLFEGPIKVGDRVEIAQLNGDVVKIGARSTWVRTNDNIIVVMPNSEFIVKPVVNWTATDRQVRFSLSVGVSYGSDPEEVRAVLLRVATQNRDVLSHPAPDVIFTGFGDSSLNFQLRYWTVAQVQTPLILKSDLYFAIFRAFKELRIEIPYPQRDLHLRSDSAPLQVHSGGNNLQT
ncbi:MAG TPA: mechanosensitive ion channel domain-containing protein [Bryobacteraceae bacterium]|nr:mechanosensitive ion channel domain-containing protein [Bryobacteraceae bacterium]